jgi:hypothetical protein
VSILEAIKGVNAIFAMDKLYTLLRSFEEKLK